MARSGGFEPPTAWFVARYSIQLSYERVSCYRVSMAVREGFEPSIRLQTVYSLSRGAPSATRPPHRNAGYLTFIIFFCKYFIHEMALFNLNSGYQVKGTVAKQRKYTLALGITKFHLMVSLAQSSDCCTNPHWDQNLPEAGYRPMLVEFPQGVTSWPM